MIRILIVFSLLAAAVLAVAGDRTDLLGRWNFESSSKEIPDKCRGAYLDFVSISRIEGSDGSRKGVIEYSAEAPATGEGYNLIAKKISDDGKPSCYGKEPKGEDKGKLEFYYVLISPDGQLMKLYFSKNFYHIYRRDKKAYNKVLNSQASPAGTPQSDAH